MTNRTPARDRPGEADGQRGEDTNLQGAGRRIRLPGLHVWAAVLGDDWSGPHGHASVEEEYPAHGREDSCDDRPQDGVARDHGVGGQVESLATRLGELLQGRLGQTCVSGARQLHRYAVAPVVAQQVQGSTFEGRELSILTPLRALRSRA